MTYPEFEQRNELGAHSSHDRWAQFGDHAVNVDANPASRQIKVWVGLGQGYSITIALRADEATALARELLLAAGTLTVAPEVKNAPLPVSDVADSDLGKFDAALRAAA